MRNLEKIEYEKNLLIENAVESLIENGPFKTTPLKDMNQLKAELNLKLNELINLQIEKGKEVPQLFDQIALESEKKQVAEIFHQLAEKAATQELTSISFLVDDEALDFLNEIARRAVGEGKFEIAASLYQFLLQLDLSYGNGWIGLAICAHEICGEEGAQQTYELGLSLLPNDPLLAIYAAEFFILTDKKEKAMEILEPLSEKLINEGKDQGVTYSEVNRLIQLTK